MTINTVLFDLDGTIANTLPVIKATYAKVFEEMNIPWGNDDVMKMIGLPLKEIGKVMAGAEKEDIFCTNYQKHFRSIHHHLIQLYPGIREVLIELQNNTFDLGIVTSKSKYGADLTLTATDLDNFFPLTVTVDDTSKHKPHPEPVFYALEKLQKTPQETIYVGDSPFDIMCGNKAGVTTIAVTWGMASFDELKEYHPDFFAETSDDLLKHILSLS
ncbi:HAD family hydrolase [Dehalobacterium formicoaceticum]|uniref:HAD-IA family hydrolase n=1 Tax=Dehalobacterium formicoaceticum TaxID=51515 RepID=A0ABT1Y6A3_9FIRM|nr:HAD-IA family hydrolase [Dehalobacterium formicoaceticum]MCR6545635.1 HAD-IA family hydrolase [Dehalobacterium formicoaceticum]